MRFSTRLPPLTPNALSELIDRERTAGRPIIDLTLSNPTKAALAYPPDLLAGLAHPRGLTYTPAPLGLPEAREAVAADYARRGRPVPPGQIVLTASTSEAYSVLFKILCDPGDEVLAPRPSYPLFEHLTRLDGVGVRFYTLDYHGKWAIDCDALDRAPSSRTRAVLLVSPNNPTGSFVTPEELDRVLALCERTDMPLIVDEVFADYELAPGAARQAARALDGRGVLRFSLGGLSKSVGLPQVKLAWMAVTGPAGRVAAALERLELVCDTYLSVATPVQAAAAELFEQGGPVREAISARVRRNLASLAACVDGVPSCRVLDAEGGWYAVLQVPTLEGEDRLVLRLLRDHGVLVHPGYFFDFPAESFLVVSLLVPPSELEEGVTRVLREVGRG